MPFASNNGIHIHYEVEGSGPAIVLHVGYMGRLQDWRRPDVGVVQALRDEYLLILLDPRGFGTSDKPHESSAYTPEQVAADVVAVLDDLTIHRAHFWGYSRGAAVGYRLGALGQDRIRSLILGGAHPYPRDPGPMIQEAKTLRAHGMQAYVDLVEQRVGSIPAEVQAAWLANDPLALAAVQEEASARAGDGVDPASIQLPALLYCGDRDPSHDGVERASRAMHQARFVTLPGLNHAMGFQRGSELILPHVRSFLGELSV